MKAQLTTNHPASSYNQPILLIDGMPFGCNDQLPKDYQLVFDETPARYLHMWDASTFVRKNWQHLNFDKSLAIKFVSMSYDSDTVAWVKEMQMVDAFGEYAKKMTNKQLKQIRLDAGLTQAQLAEVLRLSSQTRIAEYENGTRNPSKQTLMLYDLVARGKLKHHSRQKAK